MGKTSNAENLAELEEYKEKLNSVPTDGFRYYVVRPGDTMYSLAHANRTTEQTLSELNEGLSSATLKAGAIIKLPTAMHRHRRATGRHADGAAAPPKNS